MSLIRTIRRSIQRKERDSKEYEFLIDEENRIIHSAKKGKCNNTLCNLRRIVKNINKIFTLVQREASSDVLKKLDEKLYRLCPDCSDIIKKGVKVSA